MSRHCCQRCGDEIPEGQMHISHLGLAEYSKSSLRNVMVLDDKCYRDYFRMVNLWLVEGLLENVKEVTMN
jgi:hypothetical protein